jgi:RNA polymerase sigma factor (sigma-70 family)
MSMSDRQAMARLARAFGKRRRKKLGPGKRMALEYLYQRYGADVLRRVVYVLRELRHPQPEDLAQDITQAIFVDLIFKAGFFRRQVPLRPWLLVLAGNRARSEMRRVRAHDRARIHAGQNGNGAFTPLQQLIPHDYLALLDPVERTVFFAYHVEEKSKEEIAHDQGHDVGWVNRTLHTCYEKLRELAEPAGKVYREVFLIRKLVARKAELLARKKGWDAGRAESQLHRIRTTEFPRTATELIHALCADLRKLRQALETKPWPARRILEALDAVCARLPA